MVSIEVPAYGGVLYTNNFENEQVGCWNDIDKDWRSVCGDFHEIGRKDHMQLSKKYSHSGLYSAVQKAKYNEDRGQAYVRLVNPMSHKSGYEEIYVQIWNYFTGDDGTYDHGTQPKLMRVNSSDNRTNAFDIVFHIMDSTGDRDSESIKVAFNGGPNDWGAAYPSWKAPDNQWVRFDLRVKLNTPGASDGLVEFWIDGLLKAKKYNINIRGNNDYKINNVLVGGWYSNSGANSDQFNYRYIDDLVISTQPIGNISTSASTSSSASNAPSFVLPPSPTGLRAFSVF